MSEVVSGGGVDCDPETVAIKPIPGSMPLGVMGARTAVDVPVIPKEAASRAHPR
ncbi:hypothetical protein PIB30_048297 [Stylosanthes scabra]|uniref:Uncharacterized protein n=1 Tax=Stylosanthes scabra TaxID=79078 RepID=A0ABU6VIJ5_9FABA|nr:hypothetical protein [Stylosanthes scabra]